MYDLISIGSISIDFYFKSRSFTLKDDRFQLALGGKYIADFFQESLGGGGANIAIGVRKHGYKTAVVGKIGQNIFKKIIIDKLENEKVGYNLCDIEDNYYNVSTIILDKNGERSIIHYATPHQHILDDIKKTQLIKTRLVYLGNLPDVCLTTKVDLIKLFKKNQIPVILNLGVSDCRRPKHELKLLLEDINILILNGHEFAELVRAPYKDIHYKDNVVKWYFPFLKDKLVIVTEGEKGSFAYYFDNIFHIQAIKPKNILDATGAGDGYTAGFISEYLKEKNIEKSMEKGAKYAAKILEKVGAN